MAFAALAFAVGSLPVAAALALLLACAAFASGIPFAKIFPHRRLLAPAAAAIVAAQALFRNCPSPPAFAAQMAPLVPEWVPLAGGLGASWVSGLIAGLAIACRAAALAIVMPLLTLTTEPRMLAYGMAKLGAGYRAAHVVASTLGLARSFEAEIASILEARRLRGSAPRGLPERLAEYRAIALPLMVKVMRRSLAASLAMDSRAFGSRSSRTWLGAPRMGRADFAALAAGGACAAAALAADIALRAGGFPGAARGIIGG